MKNYTSSKRMSNRCASSYLKSLGELLSKDASQFMGGKLHLDPRYYLSTNWVEMNTLTEAMIKLSELIDYADWYHDVNTPKFSSLLNKAIALHSEIAYSKEKGNPERFLNQVNNLMKQVNYLIADIRKSEPDS